MAVIEMWGDGFWSLLTFSMQMLACSVQGFMWRARRCSGYTERGCRTGQTRAKLLFW